MNARAELDADLAMLDRVTAGGTPAFRLWTCDRPTVVMGRSAVIGDEVDEAACRARDIEILRRASGGGTVVIGPGTLQWAFALPHLIDPLLQGIPGAKNFCNALLVDGLVACGSTTTISVHNSGDLMSADRKVGGIALKRKRDTSLVHGTILIAAELELIDTLLRHPPREPDYRSGRSHRAFLANLDIPALDQQQFQTSVQDRLQSLALAAPSGLG